MTYCAGCRTTLASAKKPTLHLLDLFFNPSWPADKSKASTGALSRWVNRGGTKESDKWRLWDVRNQAEFTGRKKRSKRAGYIPWQDDLVVWREFHRPDKTWKNAEEVRAGRQ